MNKMTPFDPNSTPFTFNPETREIVFGEITCWHCKGTKQVTTYIPCPNNHRKMRGRACTYCGSRNQHDHESVGSKQIECYTCKGKGVRTIDRFDMGVDMRGVFITAGVRVEMVEVNRNANFNESYIGYGLSFSIVDYGRYKQGDVHTNIMNRMLEQMASCQPLSLVNKQNKVATKIVITMRHDGWSAKGVWEE